MLNQLVLIGRLGSNPDVRVVADDRPVASFSLAFNFGFSKDRSTGETREKTGWIKVVFWDKQAEICRGYLTKGSKVAVMGKLAQEKWTADDGAPRSAFVLHGQSLEFIQLKQNVQEDVPVEDEIPF